MCGIGIVFVVIGAAMLIFRDAFWALQDFSNRAEGQVSERTEEYNAMQIVGGVAIIAVGLVIMLVSGGVGKSKPAPIDFTAPILFPTLTVTRRSTVVGAATSPATPGLPATPTRALDPTQSATQATPTAMARVGATVPGAGVAVTLHAVADPAGPVSASAAGAGRRFVACEVTVRNTGTVALGISPDHFGIATATGEPSAPLPPEAHTLRAVVLPPGEAVRGVVFFSLVSGDAPTTLLYQPPGATALLFTLR